MLIGRDSERRVIEQLIAGARLGTAGVLLVTGEPGIGKTTLLDEAAALAAGLRLLRARGTEAERELPFAALLQLLRPALTHLDSIPAPQRSALASALALEPGSTGPADRFAVGAATLSLLCRYAENAPLAVLIDDAHLLDRPSAEALLFAARRLVADPIVMLIAARLGEPHPFEADLPRLLVEGLELDAARQVVQHLPSDLAEQLYQTVAGNPLALLELADDPDRLQRLPPGVPFPVPAMLAEAFASRADRLSADARTALLVASMDDCELAAVSRACSELGVDVTALEEAEAVGLVAIREGEVHWRHPLVRSAIYTSADPTERRTAHRAVAGATPDRDRRAWHLSEAVLGADDEVAAGLVLAAEHAASRGAHAVAATAFERAARLSERAEDRAVRLVAAGEAAWSAGLPDRAGSLLDDALRLQPPSPVRIRAQEIRGDIEVKCGSPRRAREILIAAATDATTPAVGVATTPAGGDAITPAVGDAGDAAVATRLLADAVGACFRLCDASAGLEVAYRIDGLLPSIDRTGPRIIGMLASGVAKVLAGAGGTDQIRAAIALAPTHELDRDRRRQVWMVLAALFLRETGTGRALLQQAMLERREEVALGTLPGLLFVLARDDATTDRWADAEASYDEGIRLSRETGQTTELAMNLAGLAWLMSHQGRAECQELAAECLRICAAQEIHLGTVWSLFALGDLELGRGDPAAALPQYERLVDVLAEYGLKDPDLSPAPELEHV
ncbi:AAA family ATPase [Kribbella sp. NPDC048915]|uniref:AAA family ATPase n=1 Tax=Kribbella sp. NPDC048915 TaxID=3155148 RepID=UPI0033C0541B